MLKRKHLTPGLTCFPGDASVTVLDPAARATTARSMRDVCAGDLIAVLTESGASVTI